MEENDWTNRSYVIIYKHSLNSNTQRYVQVIICIYTYVVWDSTHYLSSLENGWGAAFFVYSIGKCLHLGQQAHLLKLEEWEYRKALTDGDEPLISHTQPLQV